MQSIKNLPISDIESEHAQKLIEKLYDTKVWGVTKWTHPNTKVPRYSSKEIGTGAECSVITSKLPTL